MIIILEMKNYNMKLTEKHSLFKKLINMNILHMKKYYLLIKEVWYKKLRLLILLWEKPWKNKQKWLKIKEKQIKTTEEKGQQLVESNKLIRGNYFNLDRDEDVRSRIYVQIPVKWKWHFTFSQKVVFKVFYYFH